jgi:hypothetical protein
VAATLPTKQRELEDILSWNIKMDKAQDAPEFVLPLGQSLGSGHGNYFLRCALAGKQCNYPLLAPNGYLDVDDLGSRSSDLAMALKGLEWTMIHCAVFTRWPKLGDIAQKALNTKDHTEVSELEGLCSMAATATAFANRATNEPINWARVIEEALVSKPTWSLWAPQMLEIVKTTPAALIDETAKSAAALLDRSGSDIASCLQNVHLGGAFYEKVSAIKVPGLIQPHRFRCAMLLANMLAPPMRIDSGKSVLIMPNHVQAVQKKQGTYVKLAEQVLDIAWEFMEAHSIPTSKMYGKFAARVVYHMVGVSSQSAEGVSYDNLYSICQAHQPNKHLSIYIYIYIYICLSQI